MASFIDNWWKKHDMDRDGKGCCLIIALVLCGAILVGACAAALLIWSFFLAT